MADKVDIADVDINKAEEALLNAVPLKKFQSESLGDFYPLDWKNHPTIDVSETDATVAGEKVVGWGNSMNDYLGGLHQGSLIGISANGAGMGKTSFLQQLIDAIALRNDYIISSGNTDEPLLPIILVSELDRYELKLRTLGRYLGIPYTALRSKRRAMKSLKLSEEEAFELKMKAEKFAKDESLSTRLLPWINVFDPKDRDLFRQTLESDLFILRSDIETKYPKWKGKVWPVVALDPLQRWVANESDTIMGAGSLAIWLRNICKRNGYIGFFTSDTNKSAAAQNKEGLTTEQAQAMTGVEAFRGSQEIQHACTAAMVLYRLKNEDGNPHDRQRNVYVSIIKNRDGLDRVGVTYVWDRPTGLFQELTVQAVLKLNERRQEDKKDARKVLKMVFSRENPDEEVDIEKVASELDPNKVKNPDD